MKHQEQTGQIPDFKDQTVGVIALARPTFDVPFAEEKHAGMMAALARSGARIIGGDTLLMDIDGGRAAIRSLKAANPDQVLVLQVTFTDAALMAEIGAAFDCPLSIWAPREPRLGGRLRLNAFCGLNLAAHALGLRDRPHSWLLADPDETGVDGMVGELLDGARPARPASLDAPGNAASDPAVDRLAGLKIAKIGDHPGGFDTCAHDDARIAALAGVSVDRIPLSTLFDTANMLPVGAESDLADALRPTLDGFDGVDSEQRSRSLRLKLALDQIRQEGGYGAFALRCWPETFTEYGGAVCGPAGMQGEARVPCACEADVYGALSQVILQSVADAPVFLVDLVDMDAADNTGVVWHCGQAPVSMRDPDVAAKAAIHSNRKMPLLFEFPLKAGRVTLFRISQARGRQVAVIGGAEMLKRPLAFSGTAGVMRFDAPASTVTERVVGAGLEHHTVIAYGDHRARLANVAAALKLPILDLTA